MVAKIEKMTADSIDLDRDELFSARLDIRSDYEYDAVVALQRHYWKNYDSQIMRECHEKVMNLLHEERVRLRDQSHIGKVINHVNQSESLHKQHHITDEQDKDKECIR